MATKQEHEKLLQELKFQKDWENSKITRDQFKKNLVDLGYNEIFSEWIIEDLELEYFEKNLENKKSTPEQALETAILCLERYGFY
jgi:hypothetical protein